MPYADPEEKKRRDAARAASKRKKRTPEDQRGAFGRWLGSVVSTWQVDDERAWSTVLAEAMQRGPEYDRVLRRCVAGTEPRRDTAWAIGEGLRDLGLPWCSGALALARNPGSVLDYVALLDVSHSKTPNSLLVAWHVLAHAEAIASVYGDPELLQRIRASLAALTKRLHRTFAAAYAELDRYKGESARGLLGFAWRVRRDRTPEADEAFSVLVDAWCKKTIDASVPVVFEALSLLDAVTALHGAQPPTLSLTAALAAAKGSSNED